MILLERKVWLTPELKKIKMNSHTGTRTRVAEVKTRYPNRLDYMGPVSALQLLYKKQKHTIGHFCIFYMNQSLPQSTFSDKMVFILIPQ